MKVRSGRPGTSDDAPGDWDAELGDSPAAGSHQPRPPQNPLDRDTRPGDTRPGDTRPGGELPSVSAPSPTAMCTPDAAWSVESADPLATFTPDNTPPGWLTPSPDGRTVFFVQVERRPWFRELSMETGSASALPIRTQPARAVDDGTSLDPGVPYARIVGPRAISADYALEVIEHLDLQAQHSTLSSRGALATTPGGDLLAQIHCEDSGPRLRIWELGGGRQRLDVSLGHYTTTCFTVFSLAQQHAFLGDPLALRQVQLSDGQQLAVFQAGGPIGRIEPTPDARRILVSFVEGNLGELTPGMFPARATLLDGELRTVLDEFQLYGALMNVELDPPGSLAIAAGLHPSQQLVAHFDQHENLLVRSVDGGTTLLEAHPDPELLAQSPRRAQLPLVVRWSVDGRTLLRVRGTSLRAFRCSY